MSGSEAMTTTELPFNASPAAAHSMRISYVADGTSVYKSVPGSSPTCHQSAATGGSLGVPPAAPRELNMNLGEPAAVKKKRGRPRKYGADGTMALDLMPARPTAATPGAAAPPQSAPGAAFCAPSDLPSAFSGGSPLSSSFKKPRGRPPGSGSGSSKKQRMESLGSLGVGFAPHVISVKAGEDVSSKIMSFAQNGPRAVCILSANGVISNVTLRQAATSGGTATYEGRFEILSLCGSFLLTEVSGQRSRTGGLSVSLAGPDGRVLGGCVAGLLTAASPVQVIVGSFIPDGQKESKPGVINHIDLPNLTSTPVPMPLSFAAAAGVGGGGGATTGVGSSPPSHGGTFSESSGGDDGNSPPPDHDTGNNNINNNNPTQAMLGMPWR